MRPLAMPGIDYSKWDKLVVSDGSEDEAPRPPPKVRPPSKPEKENAGSRYAHLPAEELEEILAEHEELQDFVKEHDCPEKKKVLEWLEDAVGAGKLERSGQTLSAVLEGMGLLPMALSDFDYSCLERLWRAPLAGLEKAEEIQREVGMELCQKGGIDCMRLHYYMLNYAMCGPYFFGAIDRPTPVMCYVNHLNHVWNGIGEWLA